MTPLLLAEYARIARSLGMGELHVKLGIGDEFKFSLVAEGPGEIEKPLPEEPGLREAAELLGVPTSAIRMPKFSPAESEE